jgi:RimJ/RimL family protein N-acetyltransferase
MNQVSALPYPSDREADVALRDGSTVHVRPVRAEDADAIAEFLNGLSRDSIGFRFFGMPNMDWVVSWSINVDYADRFALVAETGSPSRIVAHGSYVRMNDERAEVAFLVSDAWQGRGISTIMLGHLASIAADHGITTFTAQVLPANHRMIDVFRQSGFPVHMRSTPDAVEVDFPTSLSPEAIERFEERERTAAIAAVRHFLAPRTVAVIGASRRRGTIGGEVLHNLVTGGYSGAVYAVNSSTDVVQSLPAYHSAAPRRSSDRSSTRAGRATTARAPPRGRRRRGARPDRVPDRR